MKRLIVLALMGVCLMAFPVSAQQAAPPPPSAEDQLQMALTKGRWLEQSRAQCENALSDMWAQAGKLEAKLQQAQKKIEELEGAANNAKRKK